MLYINTRSMVRFPDGDTPFFEITTGVLQGDTLATFLFIIFLDYILKKCLRPYYRTRFHTDSKKN